MLWQDDNWVTEVSLRSQRSTAGLSSKWEGAWMSTEENNETKALEESVTVDDDTAANQGLSALLSTSFLLKALAKRQTPSAPIISNVFLLSTKQPLQ